MKNKHDLSPAVSGARFAYLDAIRGIAAVMVIYLHIADHFLVHGVPLAKWEYAPFHFASRTVDVGKIAITMFFAVSGFVIPFSLLKRRARPLTAFGIGRFFRLYPAYWLSIFAISLVLGSSETFPPISQILINATMLQGFVGVENLQGLYWTLQIELVFYVLCAGLFFVRLLERRYIPALAAIGFLGLALAMAFVRMITQIALPVALPLALFMMFFGMVWRNATLEGDTNFRRQGLALIGLFVGLMPLIAYWAYGFDSGRGEHWVRYVLSYYAAMAIFVLMTTIMKVENAFFAWLGAISYSVYLFGWVCTSALMYAFPALVGDYPAHLLVVLAFLSTLAVSSAVYYLVEKPSIAVGRRVVKIFDRRAQGTRTEII